MTDYTFLVGPVTVGDLIAALKEFPADMKVGRYLHSDCGLTFAHDLSISTKPEHLLYEDEGACLAQDEKFLFID